MPTSRRMQRLNDQIRDELADLLAREARDPRLHGVISITGVETAPDLSIARIYVSVLGDEKEAEATVAQIRRATSFFRRELAARLNLRRTPDLDFRLDRTIAEGARIQELLREIHGA
ncbi:MAG TPA: 30S ribosome-binding factor RbfA [Chloroflexota bacterium]|nr:30S ribosome-binding factor RbfA [Chloroflexota bacterium]